MSPCSASPTVPPLVLVACTPTAVGATLSTTVMVTVATLLVAVPSDAVWVKVSGQL